MSAALFLQAKEQMKWGMEDLKKKQTVTYPALGADQLLKHIFRCIKMQNGSKQKPSKC